MKMNEEEQVLDLYIKAQQEKINELSQALLMQQTKNKLYESKMGKVNNYEYEIKQLQKTITDKDREIKSLKEQLNMNNIEIKRKDNEVDELIQKISKHEQYEKKEIKAVKGFNLKLSKEKNV